MSDPIRDASYDDLIPDPRNPNRGTDRSADLIDQSIQKFGFLEPGVIDRDGQIINGHKRGESAHRLGMDDVEIIRISGKKQVYVQRDDLDLDSPDPDVASHTRQAAYWLNWSATQSIRIDAEVLTEDLKSGLDLSKLMNRRDLVRIGVQLDAPDDLEPEDPDLSPPAEAAMLYSVTPGSIWQLGRHILACGDCSDPALVARLSPVVPDLLVTSPPYGVGKDYESGGVAEWRSLIGRCFTAFRDWGVPLLCVNLGDRHTGNDGWEAHTFGLLVSDLAALGYAHLATRVWVKPPAWSQSPYWRTSYKTVDEFEYVATFATEKPPFVQRLTDEENNEWGYRSVWNMNSVSRNDIHSAMFPLELPMRCIRLYTDRDAIVYEPFCGSGTTIIACEALRRTCIAVELDPLYCAVAIKRFHEVTHVEPKLLS